MPGHGSSRGSRKHLFLFSGLLALTTPAFAQQGAPLAVPSAAAQPPRSLRVLTFEDPPFSMRAETGEWSGLAIDLWRRVAERLGVTYELEGVDPPERITELLTSGQADLAAAAIPVTAAMVQQLEFSRAFLSKSYGIATLPRTDGDWLAALGGPLAHRLRDVLLVTLAVLALSAALIWWLERRRNFQQFGGGVVRGVANGVWWAVATMTTVGYGDRAPITPAGRALGIVLMLLSLVLVSTATGIIASRLTVLDTQPRVESLADLPRVATGVVADSPMADFLRARAIPFQDFADGERAMEALLAGRIDAVVAGEAELQFFAKTRYPGQLALVPGVIDQGFVAFGLPPESNLRRTLDAALVAELESDEWLRLRQDYLDR